MTVIASDLALVPTRSELDLAMVKLKLADADEGAGWSPAYCDLVEREYRNFLGLSRAYPTEAIVPSRIVDTFWHYHILDTQAYAVDCDRVFGYFLHHYPYFGMRSAEDAQALGDAYDRTLARYQRHFGAPPADIWQRTGASRCPKCGNRCK